MRAGADPGRGAGNCAAGRPGPATPRLDPGGQASGKVYAATSAK